jgi:hypothetical protein
VEKIVVEKHGMYVIADMIDDLRKNNKKVTINVNIP